jgi:phytoene synthase
MDDITAIARGRIEKGSRSFAAAARFFAPEMRASVHLLYCWCRHCDDETDGQELGFAPRPGAAPLAGRLGALEAETREALAGRATRPEFIALSRVVERHAIPHVLPLEHLAGFAMDAAGTRYRTIDDTLKYCWHVAGAVGVMMAMVMGARERETLLRASDLGIAFQLTNIARDVIADAGAGRVYLPERWLADEGIAPEAVAASENRQALHLVTVRLLDVADDYYASAGHGLALLPPRAGLAVATARSVYARIGALVRRRGAAAWDRRAIVGPLGKAGAVAEAIAITVHARGRAALGPPPPRSGLYVPAALGDLDAHAGHGDRTGLKPGQDPHPITPPSRESEQVANMPESVPRPETGKPGGGR